MDNQPPPPYTNHRYCDPSQPLIHTHYIIKQKHSDIRHFPINASFFLLGFLFPPLWFISWFCWPRSENRYEIFWRKLNITMSVISILIILIYLWEDVQYNNHPKRDIPQWILSLFLSFIS